MKRRPGFECLQPDSVREKPSPLLIYYLAFFQRARGIRVFSQTSYKADKTRRFRGGTGVDGVGVGAPDWNSCAPTSLASTGAELPQ